MSQKKAISNEEALDSANDLLATKRAAKQKMDAHSRHVGTRTEIILPNKQTVFVGIKEYPGKALKRDKYKHRNGMQAIGIKKGVKWEDIPIQLKKQFKFNDEDFS